MVNPEDQVVENNANVDGINTTRVKLPDFVEEYTDLWFWQVEAAFDAAGISADKKKYNTIIGQLPTRVMYKLADLRTNPPELGSMYTTLKTRIIDEFADTTQTKITKLLGDIAIGDRKPSQLLADMRSKAANTPVTDELLKSLWMRNLPEQIRVIISSTPDMTLTQASTIADRVYEATRNQAASVLVNAVNNPPTKSSESPIEHLQQQINELLRLVKSNQQSRSRSQNRSQPQRSSTPARSGETNAGHDSSQRYDTCWWHWKFGAEARKCKEPCNFHPKN